MASTGIGGHTVAISSTGNVGRALVEEACRRARYLNTNVVAPEDDDSEATFVTRTDKITVSAEDAARFRLIDAQKLIARHASGWVFGLQHEFGIKDRTVWARACLRARRRPIDDDEPALYACHAEWPEDASVSSTVVLERLREPMVALLTELFTTSMGTNEYAASRDQVIDLCGEDVRLIHEVVIDGDGKEPNLRVRLPMHRRSERSTAIDIPLAGEWRAMRTLGHRLAAHLPADTNVLVGCQGQEALLQALGEITELPAIVLATEPMPRGVDWTFIRNHMAIMLGNGLTALLTTAQRARIAGKNLAVVADTMGPEQRFDLLAAGLTERGGASKAALATLFLRGDTEWLAEGSATYLAHVPYDL